MTHVFRFRPARATFAALLAAALLALVLPALAAAECARSSSTSNAFARFGDEADYVLAPGGSFETGTPGWTLSGAGVVQGNESFNLVHGSHSLAIAPYGSAVSPWVCVSSEYPSFRFVVRRLSGSPGDTLDVSLRWVNLLGITVNTSVASLTSGSQWSPTPVLQLGDSVPLWLPGTSLNLAVVFSASGGATWAVDDVYIDPYSR
jgi:hypothetical protein